MRQSPYEANTLVSRMREREERILIKFFLSCDLFPSPAAYKRDVTLWFLIGRCVCGNYDCGPGRMNGRKHKLANRQIIQVADIQAGNTSPNWKCDFKRFSACKFLESGHCRFSYIYIISFSRRQLGYA
ncbi:hypothetical protein NC651_018156 [Populus alba x Populus x berolinensis]|nr:hypothetical protein NC651_018156 [Populus alba x Populus x berolinensis]